MLIQRCETVKHFTNSSHDTKLTLRSLKQRVVDEYGADTVRLFLLFKAPVDQVVDWDANQVSLSFLSLNNMQHLMILNKWWWKQIQGQYRFIRRVWSLIQHYKLYEYYRLRETNVRFVRKPQSLKSFQLKVIFINTFILIFVHTANRKCSWCIERREKIEESDRSSNTRCH